MVFFSIIIIGDNIKKILILCGGVSSEHDVSLKSASSVINNIDADLFKYEVVYIDYDNTWYKYKNKKKISKINNIVEYLKKFDLVFPIMHGKCGEDGKLQGMLEFFNIKFVGCKTLSSAILMDKSLSKLFFKSIGLKQVPYITINNNYDIKNIVSILNFPMIVKPSNGGSSIGISKCNNESELEKGIKDALKYDSSIVIEEFIIARELEVAILEDKDKLIISNPGEIRYDSVFYDYNTKYVNSNSYIVIPAHLDKNIIRKIKDYSKLIFNKLKLKGFSRIDYFYDEQNNLIYINEVNTIPGFTDISMYPKLIENCGISYKDLIAKLINNA